jgi:hypothetical protein
MSTDSEPAASAPSTPAESAPDAAPSPAGPASPPPAQDADSYGIWVETESIRANEPPPDHVFKVDTNGRERRG